MVAYSLDLRTAGTQGQRRRHGVEAGGGEVCGESGVGRPPEQRRRETGEIAPRRQTPLLHAQLPRLAILIREHPIGRWWSGSRRCRRRRASRRSGERSRSSGCVATFQKRQESDWSSRLGSVSCRHLEQVVDELNLSPHIRTAHPPRLPLPDHVHGLVALDRSPRRLKLKGTVRLTLGPAQYRDDNSSIPLPEASLSA